MPGGVYHAVRLLQTPQTVLWLLQAGRNVLSAEHATVLDEIDLLRGKLSQLERNVLTAAAMATTPGSEGEAGKQQMQQQQQMRLSGNSLAATAAGQGIDLGSLLASLAGLGLGEDAVANLSAVGAGPQERFLGDPGRQIEQQQDWEMSQPGIMEGDLAAGNRCVLLAMALGCPYPGHTVLNPAL